MKKTIGIGLAFIVLFSLFGCGKNHVGISGRVTYSDTGEPLEKGAVVFTTSTFQAIGEIKEDGRYTLGSYSEKDGLPPGTYQVYIGGATRTEGATTEGMPREIPLIDPKFADPSKSELTCEVTASTKTFDIQVDRAPMKK